MTYADDVLFDARRRRSESGCGEKTSLRVLLIEDNEGDAALTRRHLQSAELASYDVVWVSSAEDGLRLAQTEPFDACLVDYYLAGLDGLHVVAELRNAGCEVPCILLTGSGSPELDMQAMTAGAVDYLNKDDLSKDTLERSVRYAIDRRRSEQALMMAARRDPLTNLHNRTSLFERLETAVERFQRKDRGLAVFVIDLDGFKSINDTWGHHAGDEVLKVTSARLLEMVRAYDLVARVGGDEFVLLIEDLEDALEVESGGKGRVLRMLDSLGERVLKSVGSPIQVDHETVSVSASIGIAVCPTDGVSPEGLLRSADRAMYRSKRSGGGVAFFDPDLDEANVTPRRDRKEAGIEGGFLDLAFQPQMNLRTGVVRGCEALMRWKTSSGRKMTPAECVPLFRREGIIHEIGECVRERAASQVSVWRGQGIFSGRLAVNLSATELCYPGLPGQVEELLERFPISLELELTETELLPDDLRARSAIARLRGLGVRIAIDDFGSGFSSLQRIRSIPCDAIKIDRTFVRNIAHSSQDRAIVDSLVRLAQRLGADLIAEGIEDEAQLCALADLGVTFGQGFGLCAPVTPADFEDWCSRGAPSMARMAAFEEVDTGVGENPHNLGVPPLDGNLAAVSSRP